MRDDFTDRIKNILAQKVGMRCSNPGCKKPTSGPRSDSSKAVNIGVAAQITAASPGGLRYDSSLESHKRRSMENGIWLCQNCAKLIDNDEIRYSKDVLIKWKEKSEENALMELENPSSTVDVKDLLAKLEDLVNNIVKSDVNKDDEVSYHVSMTSRPDHVNPEPDTVYTKKCLLGML